MVSFRHGSLTRTIMLFFSAGSVLLGTYLVVNIASTEALSSTAERMVVHHSLADRRRQMLLNFDEVELSIYQHLAGHHSLDTREVLSRLDQIILEIRALQASGIPSDHEESMSRLHTHITTIHQIVSRLETARTRAEEMRPLYESFFVGRLLFRRINEAYVDISRTHAAEINTISSRSRILSLLLFAAIGCYILLLLGFRKILINRLTLFQKKLAGAADAPELWPYEDELTPLVNTWDTMRSNLSTSVDEIALLKNCLHSVMDAMPSILVAFDQNGRILQWNASASHETGLEEQEALGRSIWDSFPLISTFRDDLVIAISENSNLSIRRELLRDGQYRYLAINAFPLGETHATGTVLRIDDVTDHERRETRLRQSQKMETIGTLAGGIAHNFNNILAGIVGTLSLMRLEEYTRDSTYLERLDTLETASQRAVDMVQQILSLARRQEASMSPIDMAVSLRHILQICQNTFDRSIEIRSEIPRGPLTVMADPVILEQALLNICVNAAHAMTTMRDKGASPGGVLSVHVENTDLSADALQSRPGKNPGRWWCVTIQDTGVGIPVQIQQKIFEPFFTTKPTGQGTGLGLSTTWSIIEQHDGFIQLYSEIGKGSVFRIWLPAVTATHINGQSRPAADLPPGHGLILVVDDEDIVRRTAQALLERCGYQVVTAENGDDAIKLHENWKTSIRAVLLDLTMPGKSGQETLRAMRANDPSVCVVISSGFHDPEDMETLASDGAAGFIGKPYTIAGLARGLDEAIRRTEK